ncbi:MAG: hypothetical protein EAZ91_24750 [Cytophagales bacterium]|nr:MAG: hypothetical protein EAZ91_24750 [Cytophagales bacterium]
MDRSKEQWQKEVMGSVEGLERAEPNPFLFAKIQHRIQQASARVAYVPARTVWLVAASFALLALLNWRAFQSESATSSSDELNSVATDMQLFPPNIQPNSQWSGQNF